ncbi:MAG: hypothetical protein GF317_09635 [Candidatus Lokiarchaeota archaeon]|nr:hypothetical protein [Candidatus Lokiarchaeota archaeon]MBD3199971.1 hypothetical protein [Candidatus Lokiarchaeota archaeon]
MTTTNYSQELNQKPRISKPPLSPKEFLKYLGPAFIFTASQIGGGEFITVPLLGAYLGMVGLYLVPIIAFTKIFGQYYLVQYGVTTGKTFLHTSWEKKPLRWIFFLLMGGCLLHSIMLAGLLGQTGGTINYLLPIGKELWIIIIIIIAFIIVFTRSYKLLEKTSTILLTIFLTLIVIVAILFWPSIDDWASAFIPQFPGGIAGLETTSGIETIAVLFVVLGAGFGPTIAYIWFAKDKKMGMYELSENDEEVNLSDLTAEEITRLKGWKKVILYQNIVSATILIVFSMLIWVASAQTLHKEGLTPVGWELIPQMVSIFTTTYGEWSGILFILSGAFALFSSIMGPLYGFSRLWEESFEKIGIYRRFNITKENVFRIVLILFTLLPLIFIFLVQRPMWLFSLSGMLTGPILGILYIAPIIVAYYELKKENPELIPKRYWAIALACFSGIMMFILSLMGLG